MGRRRPCAGLVKIHRSYTIAEVAELFGIHRNTVRRWTREGLSILDERKPHLILGHVLHAFLSDRKSKRVKLQPGEFYCLKCKCAHRPALDIVDYVPITAISGNLRGLCPRCETLMHRRASLQSVHTNQGKLDITIVQGLPRLDERQSSSTNGDFEKELRTNDNVLPGK